jgi:DNA-binding CsgD family transcriptional regulator
MERLRARDLRAVLAAVERLAPGDLSTPFPERALAAVSGLVGAEIYAYNQIDVGWRRAVGVWRPPEAFAPGDVEIFARYAYQHPVLRYNQRTGDGSPHALSDFLSTRQLHQLDLYQLLYRPVRAEHQVAMMVAGPPVVGLALNRSRGDFSERERLMLDLLRPHVIHAYQASVAVARLTEALAASEQGVILLNRTGEVAFMSDRGGRWLGDYFGPLTAASRELPEPVHAWVQGLQAQRALGDDAPLPAGPLVVEQEGRRLRLRFVVAGRAEEHDRLLLEEERMDLGSAAGLSPRESEILWHVAAGLTDAEIATTLSLSPRTVQDHLQQIYRKLDVSSRTAALARARELARG